MEKDLFIQTICNEVDNFKLKLLHKAIKKLGFKLKDVQETKYKGFFCERKHENSFYYYQKDINSKKLPLFTIKDTISEHLTFGENNTVTIDYFFWFNEDLKTIQC